MPQPGWSKKRERQYGHIKEGLLERGENEDKAEEIAARTVNKERARAGEARQAEPVLDARTSRRVGEAGCDPIAGGADPRATSCTTWPRRKNIEGRSKMSKAELERAVGR